MYERQLLKELEALRTDVASAAKKDLPAAAPPKPRIVPPLEDHFDHPRSAPAVPPPNGFLPPPPHVTPHTSLSAGAPPHSNFKPPFSNTPLSPSEATLSSPHPAPRNLASVRTQPGTSADPLGTSNPPLNTGTSAQQSSTSTPITPTFQYQAFSPSANQAPRQPSVPPAQASHASPSSLRPSPHEPPLGGRFVDGTKSMFIKPITSPHSPDSQIAGLSTPTPNAGGSQPFDPLRGDVTPRPATASPTPPHARSAPGFQQPGLDPLAQVRSNQMSQSMRIAPTRPRLDAREAASKLANMF